MTNRTIIYLRSVGTSTAGGAEHARNEQLRAATAAAILAGCPVRRDQDGEPRLLNSSPMIEPISGSDRNWRQIVSTLTLADTLVVASLAVIADTPSALVARLSAVSATGCKLVIADLPHIDLATIRATALTFLPMEERCQKLSNELDAFYANRAEERATYAREIQKQLIDVLYRRGIDLSDLLDPQKEAKQPVDDIRGKRLRELREGLELSAEEAGKLVLAVGGEKPFSKGYVSAIETGKDTTERADLYETALRVELGRRKVQAKLDQTIAKQAMHGQPPSEVELKLHGMEAADVRA